MQEQVIQQNRSRQYIAKTITVLLSFLSVVVIVGGSAFAFYGTIYHTMELHAQATAVVQHLLSVQARATTTASPQYLYTQVTSRTPTLNDPLDSQHGHWDTSATGNAACLFTDGAYHFHTSTMATPCMDAGSYYGDCLFQVQMTITSGDGGGIVFRSTDLEKQAYIFELSTKNGFYDLIVTTGKTYNPHILAFGRSSAVNTGLNHPNTLAIMTRGNVISLYINKQFTKSVTDNTHIAGAIGVFAESFITRPFVDAAFSNAQLWQL